MQRRTFLQHSGTVAANALRAPGQAAAPKTRMGFYDSNYFPVGQPAGIQQH